MINTKTKIYFWNMYSERHNKIKNW